MRLFAEHGDPFHVTPFWESNCVSQTESIAASDFCRVDLLSTRLSTFDQFPLCCQQDQKNQAAVSVTDQN